MNPESPESAKSIFLATRRVTTKLKRTITIICPPAIYFGGLTKFADAKTAIGTQNVFYEPNGPYTGEFNASMVVSAGGTFTIIGHSERRELGESNEVVNKKVLSALEQELGVILCVGEKERDAQGNYLAHIKQQISSALVGVQKKFVDNLFIAYEPVWAIGKKDTEAMRGADMYEMLLYIKKILTEMLGREYAETIPVLYGGSVSSLNTEDLIINGHVDGLLVGRQSLDPVQFKSILSIVDSIN